MEKISRRTFFKLAGATAASGVAAHALGQGMSNTTPPQTQAPEQEAYVFFNSEEARFIEAAVARLIPADENGPGAVEAGVPRFMDRQLAGAWGAGERLYRNGPWILGDETQGYQLPFTPAELFRTAVRMIRQDLAQRGGRQFEQLAPAEQDDYLKLLEDGKVTLDTIPGKVFFESLLSMTMEGYFSDPVYGGNRDMAAWKMIGFPGAYATFYELVDQHGALYTRPPISLGDTGKGVIHLHPVPGLPARKGGK